MCYHHGHLFLAVLLILCCDSYVKWCIIQWQRSWWGQQLCQWIKEEGLQAAAAAAAAGLRRICPARWVGHRRWMRKRRKEKQSLQQKTERLYEHRLGFRWMPGEKPSAEPQPYWQLFCDAPMGAHRVRRQQEPAWEITAGLLTAAGGYSEARKAWIGELSMPRLRAGLAYRQQDLNSGMEEQRCSHSE